MSDWWVVPMLVGGGLFAGGVVSIAWERIPAWRRTTTGVFREDFAHTLRRVDRLQPALLTVTLLSTVGFAAGASSAARTLALVAAAGFLAILVGPVAWLVPIQRCLVASASERSTATSESLRTRWLRGHVIRTGMAAVLFVLLVTASIV